MNEAVKLADCGEKRDSAMCRSRSATQYREREMGERKRNEEEEESDTCDQKLKTLGTFHNKNTGQKGTAP